MVKEKEEVCFPKLRGNRIKETYNSPRTLHTKLDAKRACCQCRETVRYYPQWNEHPGQDLAEPATEEMSAYRVI
jgi:hypothetical protein